MIETWFDIEVQKIRRSCDGRRDDVYDSGERRDLSQGAGRPALPVRSAQRAEPRQPRRSWHAETYVA